MRIGNTRRADRLRRLETTLPVDPERARARRNARRGGVTPPAAETDQEDFSAAFQEVDSNECHFE